jgi:glycine/D-amino acid oxidase-like deaminating enzyme
LVVIGGGFYGCMIASFAAERVAPVALVERERRLVTRASYVNQARIHNGYHYPRAFTTAWRSHENYRRFSNEFAGCVLADVTSLYAIAKVRTKTTAAQFARVCQLIGVPLTPARSGFARLFSRAQVEAVFEVEEAIFDAEKLRDSLDRRLADRGVEVRVGCPVEAVEPGGERGRLVRFANGQELWADGVVNCTYSSLNSLSRSREAVGAALKHELTEIALVEVPPELANLAVTVMDGPFFSLLPFPIRGLHSLTHVTYTPHAAWLESGREHIDPVAVLERESHSTRSEQMLRDAARYLPLLGKARYRESLLEIKTVPAVHEADDARPIIYREESPSSPMVSILGSKLDNVYDVLPRVAEFLARHEP